MAELLLNLETVENLDITIARLLGIIENPAYKEIVEEYELDLTQCRLWYDVVSILNYIMELYDYEDLSMSIESLGVTVKKILAEKSDKFLYLAMLLDNQGVLSDNMAIGKTILEVIEDIQLIYRDIKKEFKGIFASQQDISRMFDKT